MSRENRRASASGEQEDFVAIVSLERMSTIHTYFVYVQQNVIKLVNYEIRIL